MDVNSGEMFAMQQKRHFCNVTLPPVYLSCVLSTPLLSHQAPVSSTLSEEQAAGLLTSDAELTS